MRRASRGQDRRETAEETRADPRSAIGLASKPRTYGVGTSLRFMSHGANAERVLFERTETIRRITHKKFH
jgi:hypothetical protein